MNPLAMALALPEGAGAGTGADAVRLSCGRPISARTCAIDRSTVCTTDARFTTIRVSAVYAQRGKVHAWRRHQSAGPDRTTQPDRSRRPWPRQTVLRALRPAASVMRLLSIRLSEPVRDLFMGYVARKSSGFQRNGAGLCNKTDPNAPIRTTQAPHLGINAPTSDMTHSFGACRHDLLA